MEYNSRLVALLSLPVDGLDRVKGLLCAPPKVDAAFVIFAACKSAKFDTSSGFDRCLSIISLSPAPPRLCLRTRAAAGNVNVRAVPRLA